MCSIFAIDVFYPNERKVTFDGKTFLVVVKLLLNGQFSELGTPLKMEFPHTSKVLYFDDDYFKQFVQDLLTQEELIKLTECDGIYRNILDLKTDKLQEIEQGSLWKKQGSKYILIDNDDYVDVATHELKLFQKV